MKGKTAKFVALLLVLVLAVTALPTPAYAATPSVGDLIRFIPTVIDVTSSDATVSGYFVNLNTNCKVMDFSEFTMEVYIDDEMILSGSFGTINSFTVKPLRAEFQSFTFRGQNDLNPGSYVCGDNFYCVINCHFKYENVS